MTGQTRPATVTFADAADRPRAFRLHPEGNRYGATFSALTSDQMTAHELIELFRGAGINPVIHNSNVADASNECVYMGGRVNPDIPYVVALEIPEGDIDHALRLANG